jgi:plasmid stability protein
MAQLIVRNIGEDVVRALKRRAARNGRSAEAEHRDILRGVLEQEVDRPSFKDMLLSMPDVGRDVDFSRIPDLPRDVAS